MDHQKLKTMSAKDIKDLIQDVLHNKEFESVWPKRGWQYILYHPEYHPEHLVQQNTFLRSSVIRRE